MDKTRGSACDQAISEWNVKIILGSRRNYSSRKAFPDASPGADHFKKKANRRRRIQHKKMNIKSLLDGSPARKTLEQFG
jgi:hypothetical protein